MTRKRVGAKTKARKIVKTRPGAATRRRRALGPTAAFHLKRLADLPEPADARPPLATEKPVPG